MENEAAAYELLRADQPRQLGFFRDPRFKTAAFVAVWGAAGILSTTGPGVAANPDHIMFYFIILIAGLLLFLLTVAAQDHEPMANRAAARLEAWIGALFHNEERP